MGQYIVWDKKLYVAYCKHIIHKANMVVYNVYNIDIEVILIIEINQHISYSRSISCSFYNM
jgi:hypothetical protein